MSGAKKTLAAVAHMTPGELKQARDCYASFKNAPKESTGDIGDVNNPTPELASILRQIIDTSKEAESLWNNQQVKVKLDDAYDLCNEAGRISRNMPTADSAEKAEKEVDEKLRMATALANKCPDVKNPGKITKLYDFAKALTVQIGAEVGMLKKENAELIEKISLAKRARADALNEATVLKNAIAKKNTEVSCA